MKRIEEIRDKIVDLVEGDCPKQNIERFKLSLEEKNIDRFIELLFIEYDRKFNDKLQQYESNISLSDTPSIQKTIEAHIMCATCHKLEPYATELYEEISKKIEKTEFYQYFSSFKVEETFYPNEIIITCQEKKSYINQIIRDGK